MMVNFHLVSTVYIFQVETFLPLIGINIFCAQSRYPPQIRTLVSQGQDQEMGRMRKQIILQFMQDSLIENSNFSNHSLFNHLTVAVLCMTPAHDRSW